MEKLNFSIEIHAKPAIVWEKLWSDETYPIWTAAFGEGSTAKSDWLEGSRILFLSGDGNGMIAEIDLVKPHELMSLRHLGTYINGKEDLESDKVKEWQGAMENYRLQDNGDTTTLYVDVETAPADRAMMEKAFPDALVRLKELAESDVAAQ